MRHCTAGTGITGLKEPTAHVALGNGCQHPETEVVSVHPARFLQGLPLLRSGYSDLQPEEIAEGSWCGVRGQ